MNNALNKVKEYLILIKFIYDNKRKSISKKHTSVVVLILKFENESIIIVKGYDDIADLLYRKVNQGDFILIEGRLRKNEGEMIIEILQFWNI